MFCLARSLFNVVVFSAITPEEKTQTKKIFFLKKKLNCTYEYMEKELACKGAALL